MKRNPKNYIISVSGKGDAFVENQIESVNLTSYYGDRAEIENEEEKLAHKTTLEGIDIAPLLPISLHESFKRGDKLLEKHYLEENEEITYNEVKGDESKNNYWKAPQLLPIRLYDVNEEKLIDTSKEIKVDHYATLSYVWGDITSPENKRIETEEGFVKKKLSPGGIKTLEKALEACRHLRIDYLWMDQLCINQDNIEEKNQEVPKMRQYYRNAAVTLISIQSKLYEKETNLPQLNIIEKIIKSEWFSRSWTFQEGWLSEHTIFMFDDVLVDGRELAATWVLHQPGYSDYVTGKLEEISANSAKIATPLGWVYHKDGYSSEDKVSLGLSQTLRGIKERNRTLSIDGIYSVLGLLPYGEKVVPKYKKWGEEYVQEDIEQSLYEVMKIAVKNGYGEPFAWHGEGNNLLPDVVDSKRCLTNITGGIFIKQKNPDLENIITPEGIKINGSEYVIDSITSELSEIESREGFLIDGGLCVRSIRVKLDHKLEEIKLWGTKENLQKLKRGDSLIVPSKNDWESNIPFAILATRKGKYYYRLGLVELRSGADKLAGNKERKFTLKMDSYGFKSLEQKISEVQIQEPQAQIEISPK